MPTFKQFTNVNKAREGVGKMPNYLEIDSKILEKNLLLKNDSSDADSLENFFRSPESYMKDNAVWKLVTPTAGFCLKTTDVKHKKVFINICKLDEIPEPRDVTEAELLELWQSDDVPDYRIPLSIQEPHDEFDKSGNPTVAYDVAVNTKFFQKIQSSMVFRSFVMQVVMEGLENKYGVELKKEGRKHWKRAFALELTSNISLLYAHTEIRKSRLTGASTKPLIEELHSTNTPSGSGGDAKPLRKAPEFRIFENPHGSLLIAEFHLPRLVGREDLVIFANDDRVVLDDKRGYFLDFFVPVKVNEVETTGTYSTATNILTLKMPIISGSA